MNQRDILAAEICELFWDLANDANAPVDTSQPEAFLFLFDRYAARWTELQEQARPRCPETAFPDGTGQCALLAGHAGQHALGLSVRN